MMHTFETILTLLSPNDRQSVLSLSMSKPEYLGQVRMSIESKAQAIRAGDFRTLETIVQNENAQAQAFIDRLNKE